MTLFFVINLSIALALASHFVPWFVGRKFGPGRALALGLFGLILVLGHVFTSDTRGVGMLDLVALALLSRGVFVHYRLFDEARVVARGEAAVAAAEALKP